MLDLVSIQTDGYPGLFCATQCGVDAEYYSSHMRLYETNTLLYGDQVGFVRLNLIR